MKFYSAIANKLQARANCEALGNSEWFVRHAEKIEDLVKEHAPHGSGFDSGTKLDFDASKPNRLVFKADFHHMDEHGYYDGWSEHTVIVTADLAFGFNLRITGRDRNQIKDFIGDTFHHLGSIEV